MFAICFLRSRPIKIEDFAEHYRTMSADSDFRFSEEFEELKHVGRDQPCTAADLPCNRPKNRFTNILPYDHSRFKLQPVDDEEGSDYINANYVPVSWKHFICLEILAIEKIRQFKLLLKILIAISHDKSIKISIKNLFKCLLTISLLFGKILFFLSNVCKLFDI